MNWARWGCGAAISPDEKVPGFCRECGAQSLLRLNTLEEGLCPPTPEPPSRSALATPYFAAIANHRRGVKVQGRGGASKSRSIANNNVAPYCTGRGGVEIVQGYSVGHAKGETECVAQCAAASARGLAPAVGSRGSSYAGAVGAAVQRKEDALDAMERVSARPFGTQLASSSDVLHIVCSKLCFVCSKPPPSPSLAQTLSSIGSHVVHCAAIPSLPCLQPVGKWHKGHECVWAYFFSGRQYHSP